jgi:hypothetical protein
MAICDNPPRGATPRTGREAVYCLEPERPVPILNAPESMHDGKPAPGRAAVKQKGLDDVRF